MILDGQIINECRVERYLNVVWIERRWRLDIYDLEKLWSGDGVLQGCLGFRFPSIREERHQLFKLNIEGNRELHHTFPVTSYQLLTLSRHAKLVVIQYHGFARLITQSFTVLTSTNSPFLVHVCTWCYNAWQDTLCGWEAFHFKGSGWTSLWRPVYDGKWKFQGED